MSSASPLIATLVRAFARGGIKNHHARWSATTDEQTMTKLIQRNGIVASSLLYRPRSGKYSLFAINDGDLTQARHVGKNPLPLEFQNKTLRLGRQLDFSQRLPVRNADNFDGCLAVGHASGEKLFRCGVILKLVETALQIDLGLDFE